MANLSELFGKGREIAGTTGALREYLPEQLNTAIESVLGGNILPLGARKGINGFRSTINSLNGLQRSNHFYITIPNPRVLRGDIGPTLLPFLCESVSLPGISLATSEIRRHGYGPVERKPYAPIFVDTNMTFFGDQAGLVHRFFYTWINSIVKSDNFIGGKKSRSGLEPWHVEYKSEYSTDISIIAIDETERKLMEFKLYEAYPTAMGDIAMSWADTDGIVRIPITFTYHHWKRTDVSIDLDDFLGEDLSPIQRILKMGTAIQTLARTRRPGGIADISNVIKNSTTALGGLKGLF